MAAGEDWPRSPGLAGDLENSWYWAGRITLGLPYEAHGITYMPKRLGAAIGAIPVKAMASLMNALAVSAPNYYSNNHLNNFSRDWQASEGAVNWVSVWYRRPATDRDIRARFVTRAAMPYGQVWPTLNLNLTERAGDDFATRLSFGYTTRHGLEEIGGCAIEDPPMRSDGPNDYNMLGRPPELSDLIAACNGMLGKLAVNQDVRSELMYV